MTKERYITVISFICIFIFFAAFFVFAWQEPTANPPGGNVYAPINTGPSDQFKSGRFGTYTSGIDPNYGFTVGSGGIKVTGDSYYEGNITATGQICDKNGCIGDTTTYWKLSGTKLFPNSTDWNVGIGTTAPEYKLDVSGTIRAKDVFGAGGKNLIIGDDTYLTDIDQANMLGIYGMQNKDRAGIRLGSDGSYIFGDNGNIGIGTTSPSYKLTVNGSIGTPNMNHPYLVLDSSSSGSNNNEQSAQISLGESGRGSASLHLAYTGDGYSYIGMGSLGDDNIPDHWALRFYYQNDDVYAHNNINANDVYIRAIGKWTSQLGEGGISGSGTAGYIPQWSGSSSLGNSSLRQSGSNIYLDNGNLYIGFSSGSKGWAIEKGGTSVATLRFDADRARFWSPVGGEVLTIKEDGKVGIGTTSPSYKLQVQGDIYANGGWIRVSGKRGIYFQSYGGGWYMTDSTYIRNYGSKQVYLNNYLYAPKMYDQNNTSYYVDPAGTSKFNCINLGGTTKCSWPSGGSGDITAVYAGNGLGGGGTSGSVTLYAKTSRSYGTEVYSDTLSLRRDCSSGQVLKWSGSSWYCASDNTGGGGSLATWTGTCKFGGYNNVCKTGPTAGQNMASGWCTCSVSCPSGYIVSGINLTPWRYSKSSTICNVNPPECGNPHDGDVFATWFSGNTTGTCGCSEALVGGFSDSGECGGTCEVRCIKIQ